MSTVERKRSIQDRVICSARSLYYSAAEPLALRVARRKYERFYTATDSSPLISVYIPTYNRAQLLVERSVPSVLAQTYRNLELVIVGDCCTDNTADVVAAMKDSRIRFHNLPKRSYRYPPTAENHWLAGPVVPANEALKLVQGKWIARIDDDDTWAPCHLESSLDFARAGGYEFVSSSYVEERDGKQQTIGGFRAASSYYTGKPDEAGEDSPKIGATQTWLYRSYLRFFRYNIDCWRKAWNRVNDIDLSIRMYEAGVYMGFLDEVHAYVLPRPGEQTVGMDAYRRNADQKEREYTFRS